MKPSRRRFNPAILADIIARQGGKCGCGCGEDLGTDPREIQFDHFISLGVGGEDTPDNLRALLKRHHLKKTAQDAAYRAKLARIEARAGLMNPKLNQRDKALAKMLEKQL